MNRDTRTALMDLAEHTVRSRGFDGFSYADLAEAIGADLSVMERDSAKMRGDGPFILARVKHGEGVNEIIEHVLKAWEDYRKSQSHPG